MKYNILFYEKINGDIPVLEFLESLPVKHRAKAYWELELLEQYGMKLGEPHVKHIKGNEYKDIFELRIKFSNDISRIFYFSNERNTFIMLHGFVKKTQKTPKKELETARKRMIDYKKRNNL